jgi:protein SCO1
LTLLSSELEMSHVDALWAYFTPRVIPMPSRRHGILAVAVASLLLPGLLCCQRGPKVYDAHGVVQDVNREFGQVVIAHEEIPGLMPAMTMSFDVPDAKLLATLAPGQAIDFRVVSDASSYRVVAATPTAFGVATAPDGPKVSGVAAERDPAPPFHLTNQYGDPVSSTDLRGKAVLLDFIYTHCPGPCPILTGLHADVQRRLDPALRARVQFVSISLDPIRDTPVALRQYAKNRGADLSNWSFLTGPPGEVDAVVKAYGVGSARQADGNIAHLVVTFLIDGEGRIAHRYIGLEESDPAVLRADLEALARRLPAPASAAAKAEPAQHTLSPNH